MELTPFKDEEGNAVSFNIKLGDNWLYERDGIISGAVRLKSGANDRDFTVHYSLNPSIHQVCIIWEHPPLTKTSFGGEEELEDVCNDVEISSLEVLDFGGAKSFGSASASVLGGKVKPVGGFLK